MCDSLIEDLTEHIKSIDPNNRFTREDEVYSSFDMLDTLTTRDEEGYFSLSVFRKPTHTDQYLQSLTQQ